MDPQQRLLLKVVWECMESGGQVAWQGKDIACFVGVYGEDWLDMARKDHQNLGQGWIGGIGDFAIANRVSYHYDLRGPRYVQYMFIVSRKVKKAFSDAHHHKAARFEQPARQLLLASIWLNVPLQQDSARLPSWLVPASFLRQAIPFP